MEIYAKSTILYSLYFQLIVFHLVILFTKRILAQKDNKRMVLNIFFLQFDSCRYQAICCHMEINLSTFKTMVTIYLFKEGKYSLYLS